MPQPSIPAAKPAYQVITRITIKRQLAAARRLITLAQTRALSPKDAAIDETQIVDAFGQLEQATDELAKEFYQQEAEAEYGIR
ncbi:hypothetical protein [Paracandidimonas soli]|uniref:Uncharacterized protein n=1 Tax=Paracandidimonas soli TaxID=1917182 RepID=A0A4R3UQ37_9BURK|nr:hypothetical protein [Paracandidimonas soli]TCU93925.1 hypothetical protein EV686_11093 [Paracandidimonas soli]